MVGGHDRDTPPLHPMAALLGNARDLEGTEADGAIEGADPDAVSNRAYERGKGQCGTLGSGNHFMEVQVIDEVYDTEADHIFG